MGTEESNTFGRPCNLMVPQDEAPNRPLVPHWTTYMQAYYNYGSAPTPFLNPHAAGSYLYGYMWPNQPNSTLLQCDALHYPKKLSNKPHLAENYPSTKTQQSNMVIGDENSTELTTDLKASDSNAQLKKMEVDDIKKERKRHSNRESAKRSRIRKQQECEELRKSVDTLKDENSLLTQRLIRLSEECLELSNENDSIQEELVKMHGPESIADLLPMKPA